MKKRDHRARSRAEEHFTSLHDPFIEKQYRVLGMQTRLFALLRDSYDAQCKTEESPLD